MSTKPRIVAPDVIYHVFSKGVQDLEMFKKEELKVFFLEQLARTLKKYDFTCLAFSISLNEYHLALQSDQQSISLAMQQFNSIIAKKVNKVLGREGTVFFRRFSSVIVEDDLLKGLIRTINLKKVDLGEISLNELDHYKFCSHSVIMGNCTSDIIDTDNIMKLMGLSSKEKYLEFLKEENSFDGFSKMLKDIDRGKTGFQKPQLWVIGKEEFVKKMIEIDRCRRARIARHICENVCMENVEDQVSRLLLLEKDDLYRAGQCNVRSTARELFVSICKSWYEFSGAETARFLRVTEAAVSRMLTRFSNVENRKYLIEKVLEEIT